MIRLVKKGENEMQPAESLNLGGDLDDVEMLRDVERAFGVTFKNAELDNCTSVGDLFDRLCDHIPTAERSSERCQTAVVYCALRRAIHRSNPDLAVTPALKLKRLTRFPNVDAFLDDLNSETGLDMPAPVMGLIVFSVIVALFIGPIAAFFANDIVGFGIAGWKLAALFILCITGGVAIARLVPGHLPSDCQTMGELTRIVAAVNFRKLTEGQAPARKSDLWNPYSLILRRFQGVTKPIARETRFF